MAHVRPAETDNTTASSADGNLRISGLTSEARHWHGGRPALLFDAKFQIENRSSAARSVSIERVVFVKRHPCGDPGSKVTSELKSAGITVERAGNYERTRPRAQLRARETAVLRVGFPAVEAYQVWCDYFSFEVTFRLEGGEALTATARTDVRRVTPLRGPFGAEP
jgi:hypothetical protein